MRRSLEALKLDVRERVEVRLAAGSRWTLATELRRQARRRRLEALHSLAALGGGVALAAAFAYASGLL